MRQLILGIESSCDETGVALVQVPADGRVPVLLSHALHSQIDMHRAYGGVVPELASRDHIRRVLPLTKQVMQDAGKTLQDLDVVALHAGQAWLARCWLAQAWHVRWVRRWTNRYWACTTWKGICFLPFLSEDPPSSRSSPCWFQGAYAADAGRWRGPL